MFAPQIGFSIERKQRKLLDAIGMFTKHDKGFDRYYNWLELYEKVNNKWVRKDI